MATMTSTMTVKRTVKTLAFISDYNSRGATGSSDKAAVDNDDDDDEDDDDHDDDDDDN